MTTAAEALSPRWFDERVSISVLDNGKSVHAFGVVERAQATKGMCYVFLKGNGTGIPDIQWPLTEGVEVSVHRLV